MDVNTGEMPAEIAALGERAGWRVVVPAPAGEDSSALSKDGRRVGLAVALLGGAVFWGGLAAAFLLRH